MTDNTPKDREALIEKVMYELTGGGVNTDWDLARDKSEEIIDLIEQALSDKCDDKTRLLERALNVMHFHAGLCEMDIWNNFSGSEEHLSEYRTVMKEIEDILPSTPHDTTTQE